MQRKKAAVFFPLRDHIFYSNINWIALLPADSIEKRGEKGESNASTCCISQGQDSCGKNDTAARCEGLFSNDKTRICGSPGKDVEVAFMPFSGTVIFLAQYEFLRRHAEGIHTLVSARMRSLKITRLQHLSWHIPPVRRKKSVCSLRWTRLQVDARACCFRHWLASCFYTISARSQ